MFHILRGPLTAALLLIPLPAGATTPPPCDGAEAWARMSKMTISGMQAMAVACAPDTASAPCQAFSLAIVSAPVQIKDGDSELVEPFSDWLIKECPNVGFLKR